MFAAKVEIWTESTDRTASIIAATLGFKLRKFRPITETWDTNQQCVIRYHFSESRIPTPFGEISLAQIVSLCSGGECKRRPKPLAAHAIRLLRDLIRNNEKLKRTWTWARDRSLAIILLTFGLEYKQKGSSIDHVSFTHSFPKPVRDEFFGVVDAISVERIMDGRAGMSDGKLTPLVMLMKDAFDNVGVFNDWEKNKVMPQITLREKPFDLTVALEHPGKVIDTMRRFGKRYA